MLPLYLYFGFDNMNINGINIIGNHSVYSPGDDKDDKVAAAGHAENIRSKHTVHVENIRCKHTKHAVPLQ